MKGFFTTLLTILMLASCTEREAMLSNPDDKADSLALKVGVMPVVDCLPLFYAQRTGIFDSLDLDVRLVRYQSMMDVDTALQRKRVQMGYTALPRIELMAQQDSTHLLPLVQGQDGYALMLAPKSKIRKAKQLGERMVGLARYTTGDYLSDLFLQGEGLPLDTVFRPQFNDVALRCRMLTDSLVDAAMLPQPYALQARLSGCRQMKIAADTLPSLNCLASHRFAAKDTLRQRQQRLLLAAYDMAVEALQKRPDSLVLRTILREDMAVDAALLDSLRLPRFAKAQAPLPKTVQRSRQWLEARRSQVNN
ncbi:MAG: ABC transporter substrate-binding protein [Bacteroidaceae bacterium]|nr:ABC transporter substrate-binding protein [Prevotellaceae bacterium]MDY5632574.1 ABC transporter substrate-binding protein [Bacteroidaceae bacterium]